MSAEEAMLARDATCTSERETSMCCPLPVFARYRRAERMPLQVYRPVDRSVIATPTLTGGPLCSPELI